MWRKVLLTLFLLIAAAVSLAAFYIWRLAHDPGARQEAMQHAVQNIISAVPSMNSADQTVLPHLLGFGGSKTYLVVLLNNTEMRPGGGFIGAYAVVRFTSGTPHLITVAGTELLDSLAPPNRLPEPPPVLKKYLKVERWYFRDSNWSPDFASSSAWGLDLYGRENGMLAGEVDGVIGFTPTVVEELLKIIGPITVQGQAFTAQNFTEKLEYEVEYGYKARGLDFRDRKGILSELFAALGGKVTSGALFHWTQYLTLVQNLLAQKQIVVYARDPLVQATIVGQGFGGTMAAASSTSDYVLWADANLGALKTDAAVTRALTYRLTSAGSSTLADARMTYGHHGTFDWRTSRYIGYSRVYVPLGSRLVAAHFNGVRVASSSLFSGADASGHEWFGTTITFEPGTTSTLSFQYQVPAAVTAVGHPYRLLVQKQIGTLAPALTVDVDLHRAISATQPVMATSTAPTTRYYMVTDLARDRLFEVTLE